jgi:acyl-CoA reductase-like NAD-dependent aldehyde dehydrogenase
MDTTISKWVRDIAVPARDGATMPTVDPSTGELIADVPRAGEADVAAAVRTARAALHGPWSTTSPADRGRLLARLAALIDRDRVELARLESLDAGKPITAVRGMDLPATVEHFEYFSGWPTKIEGATLPVSLPGLRCETRKVPVGVCGQIIPWNFPLLMAAWKLAPALAAGCTAILKPAEQTPLTALRLAELVAEAGFPPGVVTVLTGDRRTGAALVDHPDVDKIAFTGSTAAGRAIGAAAGGRLAKVTLELGGKSPALVLPDADLDAAVAGAFRGGFVNSGQVCTATSRLLVHRDLFEEVVERLAEAAVAAKVGPALDPDTELGPLVSAGQYARVRGHLEQGVRDGATLRTGRVPGADPEKGYFVSPVLATGVPADSALAREEVFGPVLVAEPFDDLGEAVARANDTRYGLVAGVWTNDLGTAGRLTDVLRAGSVYLNTWGAGDPAAPFGGVKASGLGREHGREGLEAYLETKTVWAPTGANEGGRR